MRPIFLAYIINIDRAYLFYSCSKYSLYAIRGVRHDADMYVRRLDGVDS
jgi:hypothetical protein